MNYEFTGLTTREAELSRERHGANILKRRPKKSFFAMLRENLADPIIKILIGALIANIIFTFRNIDWSETIGIIIAIIIATVVSTLSERGSEQAFERLAEESGKSFCRAMRNKKVTELPIDELVVGDIVFLGSGEKLPADGKLLTGFAEVDQSALNGEGREAHKRPSFEAPANDLSSRNMLFRGSTVCSGEGVFEVTAVGEETLWGSLALEVQADTRQSPLKLRLSALAKTISKIGYIAAALVAAVSLFNAFYLDCVHESGASFFTDPAFRTALLTRMNFTFIFSEVIRALTLAVTVIVVAVPEGLPMMITVVLSSNMKKMLRDNVLVRKLVGIETAGSLNILFTDKTGTLTEGIMTADCFIGGNGENIGGLASMKRRGAIWSEFVISAICNSSSRLGDGKAVGGNATDRAITSAAAGERIKLPELSERIPFDSSKKFSAVRIGDESYIKGAPEKILHGVTQSLMQDGSTVKADKALLFNRLNELTKKGMRAVAVAKRSGHILGDEDISSLTLICIVGIRDKPRREARSSVEELTRAGIQVVMITGDNGETARSVAAECGILTANSRRHVLSGEELAALGDDELKKIIHEIAVIYRALPGDKSRLVRLAQQTGLVAGMTGDGINDAPALKIADVGFSMGSGTDVAREASDIVILDDNIASILRAVLYGRTIFKSIRKFIVFQLTMNLCAVGVSLAGPFVGIDTPVTVMQMLWINIIMDTFGGLAFAGEPPLERYMREPPKRRSEPILNSYMIGQIAFTGIFTVTVSILFLSLPSVRGYFDFAHEPMRFLTAFFAMFIFQSVLNCFNARTSRLLLLRGVSRNIPFVIIITFVLLVQLLIITFGGNVFRTVPLSPHEFFAAVAVSFAVIPADLLRKLWLRFSGRKTDL